MTKQQEIDKFNKNVHWYQNVNNSWTAVYNTKHVCYSVAGTPYESRKKVQGDLLERLYLAVKEYCTVHNVPLFEETQK